MVKFQVWDGTGFKQVAPFMAGDRDMVRKMVEETAAKYAAEKKITPRDCARKASSAASLMLRPARSARSGLGQADERSSARPSPFRLQRTAMSSLAAASQPAAATPYLSVNNIEVIYDHVILVLKGVSLEVPEGQHRRAARRQRRRQDHDAEGDLEPAARRARRRHQGHDRVQGQARRQAHAQRARAHGRVPGDGRPALLPAPDRRGEPAHRRVHAPELARRVASATSSSSTTTSRGSSSGGRARPATPRAASSR